MREELPTQLVRVHHRKAQIFLAATQESCLGARAAYQANIGPNRNVASVDLEDWRPGTAHSWLMAIFVCPGDEAEHICAWAAGLAPEARARLRFFFMDGASPESLKLVWSARALGRLFVRIAYDWGSVHADFGFMFSTQLIRDLSAHPEWFASAPSAETS